MHNNAYLPRQAFLRQSHSFVLVFLYYAKLLFFRLQNYCLPHTYMHTHINTSKMDIIYSCNNLLGITHLHTYIHACTCTHLHRCQHFVKRSASRVLVIIVAFVATTTIIQALGGNTCLAEVQLICSHHIHTYIHTYIQTLELYIIKVKKLYLHTYINNEFYHMFCMYNYM